MAVYAYKARDLAGKIVSGQLDGRDQAFIASKIGEMGYVPVRISTGLRTGFPPVDLSAFPDAEIPQPGEHEGTGLFFQAARHACTPRGSLSRMP